MTRARLTAFLQLTCFSIAVLAGEQASTGLILGRVVDATSGHGVSGVVVTLGAPPNADAVGELLPPTFVRAANGQRALTDGDGRFLFRDLPAGSYALTTTAPGYAPGAFGQARPDGPGQQITLAANERLGDVIVKSWKLAAISGSVVDERGEPAVGVAVRCFQRVISGGQPRYLAAGLTANTDDRGAYRSASLVPGSYICGTTITQDTAPLSAIALSDTPARERDTAATAAYQMMQDSGGGVGLSGGGFRVGDLNWRSSGFSLTRGLAPPPPSADGRIMAYPQMFFPAAATTTQATVIELKAGEDRAGLDIQLRLLPAVRISGRVTGPNNAGPHLKITLVPASGNDMMSEGAAEAASTYSDAEGRFVFLGVTSGQYVLKIRMYPHPPPNPAPANVQAAPPVGGRLDGPPGIGTMGRAGGPPPPPPPLEPTLSVTLPVNVGDRDITDLAVQLRTGARVTGRLEFVGQRAQPSADQIQRLAIRLQSAEGRTSSPIPTDGRAGADGVFRMSEYPAGRYIVGLVPAGIPAGWSLKSALWQGRDISVEAIELADRDVSDVVLTFTDRKTTLSGTATNSRNQPDPDAEVIVFPSDANSWREIGVAARRWRDARVTKAGVFTMTDLPAGEYYVVAVTAASVTDPRDPKYLATLIPGATKIVLADGESKTVQLRGRQ